MMHWNHPTEVCSMLPRLCRWTLELKCHFMNRIVKILDCDPEVDIFILWAIYEK